MTTSAAPPFTDLLAAAPLALLSGGAIDLPAPPLWAAAPFSGLLLSIAVCPLVLRHGWWDRHMAKVTAGWSLAGLAAMLWAASSMQAFGGVYGPRIFHTALEYVSFIVLLGSLYVIAGGVHISGSMSGRPLSNALFLGAGSVLASVLGTTGAAMVMVRPLIKANKWRKRRSHTVVFFIFTVCNVGGVLTPIGDPPLFIGFLRGVPFQWPLRLFPAWLFTTASLLAIFFLLDRWFMRKEADPPEKVAGVPRLRVEGAVNVALLGGVLAAVVFSGVVRFDPIVLESGRLEVQNLARDLALMALAGVSLRLTPARVRHENHFNFAPIKEVAVLFAGVFWTMIPALMILDTRGREMGVESPAAFFWACGGLSSFLDNTPTYIAFLELAQAHLQSVRGWADAGVASLIGDPLGSRMLEAVSLGAVFMGANTYIGNGPNFMVKSIAEQHRVDMPSFFGYMLWSVCVLVPLFWCVEKLFIQ